MLIQTAPVASLIVFLFEVDHASTSGVHVQVTTAGDKVAFRSSFGNLASPCAVAGRWTNYCGASAIGVAWSGTPTIDKTVQPWEIKLNGVTACKIAVGGSGGGERRHLSCNP